MSRKPSITYVSKRGSSGAGAGPTYAQISPPISATLPAVARTRSWKLVFSFSAGWSMHAPSVSNFQPWYGQRSPSASTTP